MNDAQDVNLLVGVLVSVLVILTYEFAGVRLLVTSIIYRLLVRSACTPIYFADLTAWGRP